MHPSTAAHTSKLVPNALAVGLLAMLFIGGVDVLTGPEITMSPLYVVNVVFVAWGSGRRSALLVAAGCSTVGVIADHLVSEPYLRFSTSFSSEAVPFWNGLSRLAVYAVVAHVVAELHGTVMERERLIRELREAATNIRKLEGLLPMCAWCKRLRDDERDGAWVPMDAYIATHTDAEISHGICPRCAEQHFGGKAP